MSALPRESGPQAIPGMVVLAGGLEDRAYQRDAIAALSAAMRGSNRTPVMLSMPTGSGKTAVAATIVQRCLEFGVARGIPYRVVFLVDTKQLVGQTRKRFVDYGIQDVSVLAGEGGGFTPGAAVTIATQQKAGQTWTDEHGNEVGALPDCDLLVIDEGHVVHAGILKQLRSRPKIRVIGLSASPFSDTAVAFYGAMVSTVTARELLEPQEPGKPPPLVDFKVRSAELAQVDLSGLKTGADGEMDFDAVGERAIRIVGDVVTEWEDACALHFGGPMATIVFPSSKAHGRALQAAFQSRGHQFAFIDGDTPAGERDRQIAAFESGGIIGLISCNVLSKGFDAPLAAVCIMCRPFFKSLNEFVQQLGRILRWHSSKPFGLLQDHVGNWPRFQVDYEDLFNHGPRQIFKRMKDATERRAGKRKPAKPATIQGDGLEVVEMAGELRDVERGVMLTVAPPRARRASTHGEWWGGLMSYARRNTIPHVVIEGIFERKFGRTPGAFGMGYQAVTEYANVDQWCRVSISDLRRFMRAK